MALQGPASAGRLPTSPTAPDHAPLCRVCRSDDPSLGPLFHPCRCTGSIAHVHQDCLSTWLAHSKKTSCELCAHAFSFEKVYKPGSPLRPPLHTIVVQAGKEMARLFVLVVRACLVAVCWLAIVPWIVVSVSSAYWNLSDWFAFGLTSHSEPRRPNTTAISNSTSTNPKTASPVFLIHLDPNTIALDIFQGQLITCAVILTFVVIFLLREWILQNTPPQDAIHLEEEERLDEHQAGLPAELDRLMDPVEPFAIPFERVTIDADDLFPHQILVTAAYMLFIARPTTSQPFVPPELPPHETGPAALIEMWKQISSVLSTSSNKLHPPLNRLRTYLSHRTGASETQEANNFQALEHEWTSSILRDRRISKYLQDLFTSAQPPDQKHTKLIANLVKLVTMIDQSGPLTNLSNVTNAFFEPPPSNIQGSARESRLVEATCELVRSLGSEEVRSGGEARLASFRKEVVRILVMGKVLGALVNSPGFVHYAREMLYDEQLFTTPTIAEAPDRTITKEESGNLNAAVPNHGLLVTPLSRQEVNRPNAEPEQPFEPITPEALDHRLLVTSLYRLKFKPSTFYPIPAPPDDEIFWVALFNADDDLFQNFRDHLNFGSTDFTFIQLETQWLEHALSDSKIFALAKRITQGLERQLLMTYGDLITYGAGALESERGRVEEELQREYGDDNHKLVVETEVMLFEAPLNRMAFLHLLISQRLLVRILHDERFVQYAIALLEDRHLFQHQEISAKLDLDKGKSRAVGEPDLQLERSSHVDAFNWLEVDDELPVPAEEAPAPAEAPVQAPLPPILPANEPLPPRNRWLLPAPGLPEPVPLPIPAFERRQLALMEAGLNQVHRAVAGPEEEAAEAAGGGPVGPEDELLAEDLDGILELIGMKGSLWMLAQNVGLMTMLLSLSILAFVHLPHLIGKIAVLSRAYRLLVPPLKGLFILRGYVHQLLDHASVHFKRYFPQTQLHRLAAPLLPSPRSLLTIVADHTNELRVQSAPIVASLFETLERIGTGSKPLDRALAVLLGYTELILLSLLYLSSGLDHQRARFVSDTMTEAIRQQAMIAKVGTFIFVELVIFPFLCGILLTITSLPLFEGLKIGLVLERFGRAPYATALLTWLAGTCFMFLFAILVSTCRESLRPGVCWWIRDPSDDRFNPIREILDRPTWAQIKKILSSAIMYGSVIVLGIGGVISALQVFVGALPLRIHLDRPISSAALDLIAYQSLLPLILDELGPRTILKKILQQASKFLAAGLRLSCFLYGGRRLEEETTLEVIVTYPGQAPRIRQYSIWSSSPGGSEIDAQVMEPGMTIETRRKSAGGSFARVPATDAVKIVPGRKMHIPVYVNGDAIDLEDAQIITQQEAEGGAEHYTVVYLPPHFKLRIMAYLISMWSAGFAVGFAVLAGPLMLGRVILDHVLMVSEEPHDAYAYAFGTVAWAGLYGLWKGRGRMTLSWRSFIDLVGFMFGVGLILPILTTTAIELYVLGHIRAGRGSQQNDLIPTVYAVQAWAYGVVWVSILSRLIRVLPNWVSRAQDEVMQSWSRGEKMGAIKLANKKLIYPIILRLIGSIILPATLMIPILSIIPNHFLKKVISWNKFKILRSFYPILISWYSHYHSSKLFAKGIGKWIEKVRDDRFLEERRLKNYEPVVGAIKVDDNDYDEQQQDDQQGTTDDA